MGRKKERSTLLLQNLSLNNVKNLKEIELIILFRDPQQHCHIKETSHALVPN